MSHKLSLFSFLIELLIIRINCMKSMHYLHVNPNQYRNNSGQQNGCNHHDHLFSVRVTTDDPAECSCNILNDTSCTYSWLGSLQ